MNALVADAEARVRSALHLFLLMAAQVDAVHEASDAQGLARQLALRQPNLVLLDWGLAGKRTAELLPVVRNLNPTAKVLVLSVAAEDRGCALAAGADAFATKGSPPGELFEALRRLDMHLPGKNDISGGDR